MTDETCTIDGGKVLSCTRLWTVTHAGNPPKGRNGIFVWQFERVGGEITGRLFGAQSERHPSGLIFNFCPYCGVDLRPAAEALQRKT